MKKNLSGSKHKDYENLHLFVFIYENLHSHLHIEGAHKIIERPVKSKLNIFNKIPWQKRT